MNRAAVAARSAARAVRPYALPLVLAIGVGAVSVVLVSPRDAVLIGLVVLAVATLARVLDRGEEHAWPESPAFERRGARRDVTAISWTFVGRDGRVSEAAVRRLREDARRRLALRGVHVPDLTETDTLPAATRDEARALLGPAWDVLTARAELPTMRQAERCIATLEALVPPTGPEGALTVPTPTPRLRPPPARTPPAGTPPSRTHGTSPRSSRPRHPDGRTPA